MDVTEGALLVAEIAYPHLDHASICTRLDVLARQVRREAGLTPGSIVSSGQHASRDTALRTLRALADVLGQHEDFHGNERDYYDPRNSFLNDVLERQVGLPITLSVLYMSVAQRIGAPLLGVGLPSHFLTKWPLPEEEGGDVFIDAFRRGTLMSREEIQRFTAHITAENSTRNEIEMLLIQTVSARQIITRMLNNLKAVYLHRGEMRSALDVEERLMLIDRDNPLHLRDKGLLRLALGDTLLASADLAAYEKRAPDAQELARLRVRFARINEIRNKLN
jgi:regulator of sirC expression with transglutaminase-like and TPR domain